MYWTILDRAGLGISPYCWRKDFGGEFPRTSLSGVGVGPDWQYRISFYHSLRIHASGPKRVVLKIPLKIQRTMVASGHSEYFSYSSMPTLSSVFMTYLISDGILRTKPTEYTRERIPMKP